MALALGSNWSTTGGRDDVALKVSPTADRWLIVTISYRTTDGTLPLATVGDLARNWWTLLGVGSASGGAWKIEVWACPIIRYAPNALDIIYTAVQHIHADDTGSVGVFATEVSGFVNGFPTATITPTSGTATAASTFSLSMPAPTGSANSACFAVAAIDDASKTLTVTSAGWTSLSQPARTGPDLKVSTAFRTSTTSQTPAWQISSGTCNWVGVVVALAETGTAWAQPNASWPATKFYLGANVGLETPLPRVAWTDHTSRFEGISAGRGIQPESGRPVAGTATITLRDFDDVITPSAGGTYDLYTPYQLLMAWGSPLKIYPVSSGWIEDYPRRWRTAAHTYVDAAAVDALATLTQDTLSPLQGEILRFRPYAYWPLADPSGSTNALNISGRSVTPLNLAQSKFGVAAATADFGASTQIESTTLASLIGIAGDSGTGWQQQGLVSADTDKGYCLNAIDDNFPAISGGVTIVGYLMTDQGVNQPNTTDLTICQIRNLDPAAGVGQGAVIRLAMKRSTSTFQVTVWDKDTHAKTITDTGKLATLAPLGFTSWILRFNRTGWDFRVPTAVPTASGSCDLVDNMDSISIGGQGDSFWNGECMNAAHAHIALYDRYLSDEEVEQIGYWGRIAWYSEYPLQRIQRYLATTGVNTPRVLASDAAVDGSATGLLTGDGETGAVAQTAANVAAYEDGLFCADGASYLRFVGRNRAFQQSSRFTLGDSTAGGEIPFDQAAKTSYSAAFVFNQAVITNLGENLGTLSAARVTTIVDTDSISRYNPRPVPRTTRFLSTGDAFGLGNWLVGIYRQPKHRFEQVVIDAASLPSNWALVLSIEVGDLVTVVRRSLGVAAVSVLCKVMQVKHDLGFVRGGTRGQVTLTLTAAAPPVLVLNDPVKQVLGNVSLGW